MPCFFPNQAFRSVNFTKLGKRAITFDVREAWSSEVLSLPCGQCKGCRLERSRQWACRCIHEASLHRRNCFITLTYSPDNLPVGNTLVIEHFQKFMKRLRKKFGNGIRFFHCGEYGERTGRPHYHALLFGFDFPDKYYFKTSPSGEKLYRSPSLEKLWKFGYSSIGAVTFDSAAYVARYVLKKINGKLEDAGFYAIDYDKVDLIPFVTFDPFTGELLSRKPEYCTMSRRKAIGRSWLDVYFSDVYSHDSVILRGKKMRPPKYYDRVYEVLFPDDFEEIKAKRAEDSRKREADHMALFPDPHLRLMHLDVLRRSKDLSLKLLPRNLDGVVYDC